jgi:PadR family transcriptional regulator, regulatory protein PadR
MHRRHRHRQGRGPRTRWLVEPGRWEVRARVERFVEPAVLLLLAEGPRHGYELLDRLPELVAEERVDVGNLYRVMRGLEDDGVVESEWRGDLPGPAKRTYRLTDAGSALLDQWAEALRAARDEISSFVDRYESREGR